MSDTYIPCLLLSVAIVYALVCDGGVGSCLSIYGKGLVLNNKLASTAGIAFVGGFLVSRTLDFKLPVNGLRHLLCVVLFIDAFKLIIPSV